MKRIISTLTFAFAATLTLAACGGDEPDSSSSSSTSSTSSDVNDVNDSTTQTCRSRSR